MGNWLDRITPTVSRDDGRKGAAIPEGLWTKCPKCSETIYTPELERNLYVCPKCDHHLRMSARQRLLMFLDESPQELFASMQPIDGIDFVDSKKYSERIKVAQAKTGEKDALISFAGSIEGVPAVASAFEFGFMGGSMGSVVGTKFIKSAEYALEQRSAYICFSASGGARMQEAMFSLLQMARTSAAIAQLNEEGIPFISVLTDPVYGGVSASLAMLGDVNIAEPGALIGFAGPRVIEQTVRETLPEGFQTSEFLLEHGYVDQIVHRAQLRSRLAKMLRMFKGMPPRQNAEF